MSGWWNTRTIMEKKLVIFSSFLFLLSFCLIISLAVVANKRNREKNQTTDAPTEVPKGSTEAPEESTEAPEESTEAPKESTEAPEESTVAQISKTTTIAPAEDKKEQAVPQISLSSSSNPEALVSVTD